MLGLKNKGGSKFAGFRGTFWFAGVIFSRGVWIFKKEKPSSGIGKCQFYLTLIVNFQKNSSPFSENNMVNTVK